jgi:hypothetical protein
MNQNFHPSTEPPAPGDSPEFDISRQSGMGPRQFQLNPPSSFNSNMISDYSSGLSRPQPSGQFNLQELAGKYQESSVRRWEFEQLSMLVNHLLQRMESLERQLAAIQSQNQQPKTIHSWEQVNSLDPTMRLAAGQSGNLYFDHPMSAPVQFSEHKAQEEEVALRKKFNKILAALPLPGTCNPIAALINFCKHQLGFDVDFRSFEDNQGIHTVNIFFPNQELISKSSDRKKKQAKEVAAKLALQRLNQEEDLLSSWIHWASRKSL